MNYCLRKNKLIFITIIISVLLLLTLSIRTFSATNIEYDLGVTGHTRGGNDVYSSTNIKKSGTGENKYNNVNPGDIITITFTVKNDNTYILRTLQNEIEYDMDFFEYIGSSVIGIHENIDTGFYTRVRGQEIIKVSGVWTSGESFTTEDVVCSFKLKVKDSVIADSNASGIIKCSESYAYDTTNTSLTITETNLIVTAGDGADPITYTVNFDADGGNITGTIPTNPHIKNKIITLPGATRNGYTFLGWYDGSSNYNAGDNYTVTKNVTLVAKWKQSTPASGGGAGGGGGSGDTTKPNDNPDDKTDENDKNIIITIQNNNKNYSSSGKYNDDGTISIKIFDKDNNIIKNVPGGVKVEIKNVSYGDVVVIIDDNTGKIIEIVEKSIVENTSVYALLEGSCSIKIIYNGKDFDDVNAEAWYRKNGAIEFVSSHELFQGIGDNLFAPNMEMSRAMLVTVLWRLENKPSTSFSNVFEDVGEEYYTEAVKWANQNGIVKGYDDGLFYPKKNITRQEMSAILYRYMAYKKYNTSAVGNFSKYIDKTDISAWAMESLIWANGANIILGRTENTIDPIGTATRAEVATMLMRVVNLIVK